MTPRHILLHGFGSFPPVFRHLVGMARARGLPITWSIILPTPHHLALMRAVLDDEAILDVYARLPGNAAIADPASTFAGWPHSIHADIDAEKFPLKHRPSEFQLRRAATVFTTYADFLQRRHPTDILFASLEGFEGKLLTRLAETVGARVIVPTGLRNLGGMFFSPDACETLPVYAAPNSARHEEAAALVRAFRERPAAALHVTRPPQDDGLPLDPFGQPFARRVAGALRRVISRPDLFDRAEIRPALLNNLPALRDGWRALHQVRARGFFDIATLDELPPKFVYYPLQMTPETSINAPAPFFVDQLRAIDAIRLAMPSDHLLVVKEHWASIMVRPLDLVRALRRRSGVVVARFDMPSIMLIRRAAATLSVTGTAAFEALLLGRPSLLLGPSFFAGFLGGAVRVDALPQRLHAAIASPPSDAHVAQCVATLLSVRHDVAFRAPGAPGEPVLRPANLERFLDGLLDHIARDDAARAPAAARA
jgi:hypothetical protein